MIDGGRLDFAQKSTTFEKLKEKSCFLSQSVTYAPHTIAAMHAMFSGSYGSRTGTNSYWSTNKFKKNEFKTYFLANHCSRTGSWVKWHLNLAGVLLSSPTQ